MAKKKKMVCRRCLTQQHEAHEQDFNTFFQ